MSENPTPEAVAAKRSDADLELWVWTVLAVTQTARNRHAFIDGYNGQPCAAPKTERKLLWHRRGLAVRQALTGESA